jgi:hypothetical protein
MVCKIYTNLVYKKFIFFSKQKFLNVYKNLYRFLLAFLFFLLFPVFTFGATFYFDADISEFGIGQTFQMDLILNTENKKINAIEGSIYFEENILELKEIREGNSIVNFWIEQPSKDKKNSITFSGIIPGGYQSEKGFIFSLIFYAKTDGKSEVGVRSAKILMNDGLGTPVFVNIVPFRFLISKQIPVDPSIVKDLEDAEAPEHFIPQIAQEETMFGKKWFLVFATQDKGSGIDKYFVYETKYEKNIEKISHKKWIETKSPYLLLDQNLKSFIYVKAIDKAGNERIVFARPRYPIKWYEVWWIWGAIASIILIIFIAFVIKKIWIKRN